MKLRWIKTHWLIKKIFPNYIWDIPNNENKVYLTFDDGPTPEITNWTLNELQKFEAKATFFCIGDNLRKYPETYKEIIQKGHAIGNHTFNHLNGWKTKTQTYIENAKLFETELSKIDTRKCNLFRPPYGKIKYSQANLLRKSGYKIIMWDVLSADYDQTISTEECLDNVLKNISSGSIIVFHDSIKGFKNLEFVLPRTLEFIKNRGYSCEVLN